MIKVFLTSFFYFFLTLHIALSQCSIIPFPLNSRLEKAEVIVEGKVSDKKCFRLPGSNRIYTLNRISVYKYLEGNMNDSSVCFLTEGGIIGDKMQKTSSMLELEAGSTGVFLGTVTKLKIPDSLVDHKIKFFEPLFEKQGFIKYDLEEGKAIDILGSYSLDNTFYSNSLNHSSFIEIRKFDFKSYKKHYGKTAGFVITSYSPKVIPAGIGELLTINGSGFGSSRDTFKIGFRNADDGGKTFIYPDETQYVKWSDTRIMVEVPSKAGTGAVSLFIKGSSDSTSIFVSIPYSRTNVSSPDNKPSGADLIALSNSAGGYVWQMNKDFYANVFARETFLNAFTKWRCKTGINWSIGNETSVNVFDEDKVNAIVFDQKHLLGKNVLAVCYSYFTRCSNGQWIVSEYDIVFRDTSIFNYSLTAPLSGQYDFESIALHELGHGHQLGHVIDKLDLMHYSIGKGVEKREINDNNYQMAQIVLKSSTSSSSCMYPSMIPVPQENCSDPFLNDYKFSGFAISKVINNSNTYLSYDLTIDSHVKVELYNTLGQFVSTILDNDQKKGKYQFAIEPQNLQLHKGLYLLRCFVNEDKYNYRLIFF